MNQLTCKYPFLSSTFSDLWKNDFETKASAIILATALSVTFGRLFGHLALGVTIHSNSLDPFVFDELA